jgi:GNAT superfamily N-acetyltransferase
MLETAHDQSAALRVLGSLGLGADAALRHYLAYTDGTVAGMATAFFTEHTVLLQHVVVLPERRRRGIGRALALARLRDARVHGCGTAVLGPTPESRRLYEPLGFTVTPSRSGVYYLPLRPGGHARRL